METVNDVVTFVNKLDLVGYLESNEYDKFIWINKRIIDEFQDNDSAKLINILGVLDNLHTLFINQHFQDVQKLMIVLRGDIFNLLNKRM